MPATIYTSGSGVATQYPNMRKIFRNPRGLQYYYAFSRDVDGAKVHKSADGQNWSLEATLRTIESIGVTYYEDATNQQLVIYVILNTYGPELAYSIYYKRGVIPDNSSLITWGATQLVLEGAAEKYPRYIDGTIALGIKSGEENVWIGCHGTFKEKGTVVFKVVLVYTTTTFPGDAPTWSSEYYLDEPPSTDKSHYVTLTPLDAYYHMHVTWAYENGATFEYHIKGQEMRYTALGTGDVLTAVGQHFAKEYNTAVAVRVGTNRVDIILKTNKLGGYMAHWSWTYGVGWGTGDVVTSEGSIWSYGFTLTIDTGASPNELYVFYVLAGSKNTIRYRTTPVDTISWSTTTSIKDDTTYVLNYMSACRFDEAEGIQILYMKNLIVRFHEISLAPPPPPPAGYSYQNGLVCVQVAG